MLFLTPLRDCIYENNAWIFGALELFLPLYVLYTAPKNEWIASYVDSAHIVYLLIVYVLLENLSAIMTLRRKEWSKNKPAWLLSDLDVEYNEPRVEFQSIQDLDSGLIERLRIWGINFFQFIEWHFAYRMVVKVGVGFIIVALTMFVTRHFQEQSLDDPGHSLEMLAAFGAMLLATVFVIANSPSTYIRAMESYEPFKENVNVPLKVLAAKVVAAYLTGGFLCFIQLPIGLYLFINGFNIIHHMEEIANDIIPLLNNRLAGYIVENILQAISLVVIFTGMYLIYRPFRISYNKVKRSLLITMELNWQRNLHAMKCLLPEAEECSLDELLNHLREKQKRPTPRDFNILLYIALPLWKPKKGFCEDRKDR